MPIEWGVRIAAEDPNTDPIPKKFCLRAIIFADSMCIRKSGGLADVSVRRFDRFREFFSYFSPREGSLLEQREFVSSAVGDTTFPAGIVNTLKPKSAHALAIGFAPYPPSRLRHKILVP